MRNDVPHIRGSPSHRRSRLPLWRHMFRVRSDRNRQDRPVSIPFRPYRTIVPTGMYVLPVHPMARRDPLWGTESALPQSRMGWVRPSYLEEHRHVMRQCQSPVVHIYVPGHQFQCVRRIELCDELIQRSVFPLLDFTSNGIILPFSVSGNSLSCLLSPAL